MRFTFSLFRLLLAVTMICGSFGFMKTIGAPGLFAPCLLGGSLAGLALITKKRDARRIVDTLGSCGLGMLVMLFPAASTSDARPSFLFGCLIIGAIGGGVLRMFISETTQACEEIVKEIEKERDNAKSESLLETKVDASR